MWRIIERHRDKQPDCGPSRSGSCCLFSTDSGGECENGDDDMTGVVMGKQELANGRASCQNL